MATTSDLTGLRATSRRLVGREAELQRLESTYDDVVEHHHADTVFVEGPAGIGKTRLVEAFAQSVGRRGGDVLVGRCVAAGEEILPFAPLVEVLTSVVRRDGAAAVLRWAGASGSELARLVPALGSGDGSPAPTSTGPGRLFQALCAVLDRLSARRPLVLVVEDLHWADRSTRDMLALLAHQLRGDVLLVLTLRTDESPRDPGLARFAAALGRGAGRHVPVLPLSRDEQARQLSDILGVPPRRDLLDEVYARAEGNPFFAEELLALGAPDALPASVRDLLLLRLESLAPATRQVLRTASVVGRQVPHRLLEAVVDLSPERLEEVLRPAVDGHVLVTDDDGGGYLFRHALLQEAVAGTLLPGEATRIHRRVAETLSARPDLAGGSAFVAGRVARHWHAAGAPAEALVASVAAAREARQARAFNEALTHYERAIRLLDAVPEGDALLDEPRYWLLWSAAEMAHLAAHPARAAELVRAAIDVVDPAQPHHHGYLYERLGRYLWMGADGHGALEAYEKAIALVPAEPPTRWRAAVLSGYSQMLMLASRFTESEGFAREAISVAGRVEGCRSIEGHARCNLGVDLSRTGRFEEAVAELLQARRIAEEEQADVDDVARAMVNLYSVYYYAGRLEDAAAVARESITVVEGLGLQRRKGVWVRSDAADALLLLGRLEEARELLDEAVELTPSGVDAVQVDVAYGQLLMRLGGYDEARARLDRAHRAGTRLLDGQLVAPLYAALVEVTTWQGELDEALSFAEEGTGRLLADEDAAHSLPLFAAGVRAAVAAGAGESAERWLARARAAVAAKDGDTPLAVAHLAAATCEVADASAAGHSEDWRAVAGQWERLGERYRTAYARLRAAEALLRAGDRRAAQQELLAAWSTADRIGAAQLRSLAEDLAGRSRLRLVEPTGPASPAEPEEVPFRLTPREREVLLLVADGLTDRQIGSRLFISHRTVERHVSNLLAKLGADRRAELTAIAHRLGLPARLA